MIGKPVALIQVPNQRLFSISAAAQYLGKHPNTIRKLSDLGILRCRIEEDLSGRRRRVFTLEDLDAYIDHLEYDSSSTNVGQRPGTVKEESHGNL